MRLLVVLLGFLAPVVRTQPPAPPFIVIVNAANPVATLPRDVAARLFLKKKGNWDSGERVAPVDQLETGPLRKAFSSRVLGRDVDSIKSYWQELIFSGRAVPPVEKATDADVVAFVGANAGAIGYVSASSALPASVKSVAIVY
jgi:ABC-type phosphate transport system substrate-binding protein